MSISPNALGGRASLMRAHDIEHNNAVAFADYLAEN
jgi:hypothetical protein